MATSDQYAMEVAEEAARNASARQRQIEANTRQVAFTLYHDEGASAEEAIGYALQYGGRQAAEDVAVVLEAHEADMYAEPLTAAEVRAQLAEQDALIAQAAERLRVSQIEAAQRQADEHSNAVTEQFLAAHPDAENFVPLIEANAKPVPGADPLEVLNASYAASRVQYDQGRIAAIEASESRPFGKVSVAQHLADQRGIPQEVRFGHIASEEEKAARAYAERMQGRDLPTPMEEGARWAAKAQPFGGALTVTGASTESERKAQALLNQKAETRAMAAQQEALVHSTRVSEFSSASDSAAVERSPEKQARYDSAATPSSSWWYE